MNDANDVVYCAAEQVLSRELVKRKMNRYDDNTIQV